MPSARLTETLIKRKALPPGESQLVIYDQLAPGLALRIGKNTRTFFVKTRVLVAGKWQQKKIQIGRADEVSLENARSQANKIKRQARNGESVIGRSERIERLRQASIQTFATVRKDFLANHVGRANRRPADSTLAEMKRVLESNEVQLWNDLPIEQVTVDLIRTAVGEVRARGAQTMANRMLAYLRLLFGHAIDQQLIADNPATQVKKFGAEVRRSRVLTLDEIRQLWTVTGASARSTSLFFPIVRILLLTGQRLNEVQGMCWSEIEFDERIWRLPEERTKNNRREGRTYRGQTIKTTFLDVVATGYGSFPTVENPLLV